MILNWATICVFAMWSMPMYHPNCVFCQSNCTRLLLFEQVNLVCQQSAEHCICTFSLPVQMPHLAKVGVCWQAAHEGRTSYWILGSTSPPLTHQPPSRWKWDTLQSESLREFLWPAISGTGDKMKLRHPTPVCCPQQKHQKIGSEQNLWWWGGWRRSRWFQPFQLITFRVIRMGMIYIFVQIGRSS